jgi:hypothetical protein
MQSARNGNEAKSIDPICRLAKMLPLLCIQICSQARANCAESPLNGWTRELSLATTGILFVRPSLFAAPLSSPPL